MLKKSLLGAILFSISAVQAGGSFMTDLERRASQAEENYSLAIIKGIDIGDQNLVGKKYEHLLKGLEIDFENQKRSSLEDSIFVTKQLGIQETNLKKADNFVKIAEDVQAQIPTIEQCQTKQKYKAGIGFLETLCGVGGASMFFWSDDYIGFIGLACLAACGVGVDGIRRMYSGISQYRAAEETITVKATDAKTIVTLVNTKRTEVSKFYTDNLEPMRKKLIEIAQNGIEFENKKRDLELQKMSVEIKKMGKGIEFEEEKRTLELRKMSVKIKKMDTEY